MQKFPGGKDLHSDLVSHIAEEKQASPRQVGLLFAFVAGLIGLWPLWSGQSPRYWALGLSALLVILALFLPAVLMPVTRAWLKLGELLGRIVNPIVLGILFYVFVTPLSVAMRMAGRDELKCKLEPDADSYWIQRDPPGPAQDSFGHQF